MKLRTLLTAAAMSCLISAGAYAQESNRNAVRATVYRGGWYVAWGVNINEAEYAKFAAAVASSVATGNAGPVLAYFDQLLDRTVAKVQKQAPGLTRQAVFDLIANAWKTQGRSIQRLNLQVQAGVATYRRWKRIVVDVPDGTERYKIYGPRNPLTGKRTWTYGYRPKFKRIERTISLPNHHQPYIKFRLTKPQVGGNAGNAGNVPRPVRWTRWNHNGGAFVQVQGGWVEYSGGRMIARFREIGRSAHAIGLYDATRQMTLSLSATKMYWKQPHTGWNFLYNGYAQ